MVKLTKKEFHMMRYLLNHQSHNMSPRENFILLVIALNRPYSIGNKRYTQVVEIIDYVKKKLASNDFIFKLKD